MACYDYQIMGLLIRSYVRLPEFAPTTETFSEADIEIALGQADVPVEIKNRDEFYHLDIDELATFDVCAGKRVWISPAANADWRDIRLFLYSTVWAALCYQRGLFPLHASAVKKNAGLICFLGDQGAGKSTMAAAMAARHLPLANDDVVILQMNGEQAVGWPFVRRSKLRQDSIDELDVPAQDHESVHIKSDKMWVAPPLAAESACAPICALYLLKESSQAVSIERLSRDRALSAIIEHTFRREIIDRRLQSRRHLSQALIFSQKIPVFELSRPLELSTIDQVARAVDEHAEADFECARGPSAKS